ncbi:condensation domain-containing protein [Streptomyces sp. NPDC054794]
MGRRNRSRTARDRAAASPDRPARIYVPVTWQQYDLLVDSFAHRGTGRHVEQLTWCWHGPLDTERFTAAWQSVVDRETVLRSGFLWGTRPRVVFHERAHPEVVRHPAAGVDWRELVERDRLRGFDLRRPCPLRITLVGPTSQAPAHSRPGGAVPVTRVLVTFHQALLDTWSVFILLEEFCRAYLAGGVLPGGERRPDLRDWARWLERQDSAPARDFWSRAVPGDAPVVLPLLPGPATAQSGCGRAQARLSAAEAERLHHWAAARAVPDSGVLQAVWALLLYRAARTEGTALVGFGVAVSGRGVAMDSVERLLGPMRTCLPMVVRIDPDHRMGRLLATLRDGSLDMAAYEWVSAGQIHEWTGRTARGDRLLDTLVALESTPRPLGDLHAELADAGIRLELQDTRDAHPAFPVALVAHRGGDGSLNLALAHDRARVSDADAELLVGHCARLLRRLPATTSTTTVSDVLSALDGDEPPRGAPPRRKGNAVRLRLRSTGGRGAVERAASES